MLISAPEFSVCEMLARRGTFQHKADRFLGLLVAIENERPVLRLQIAPVRDDITQARDLAKQRNRYVHALVVQDLENDEIRLRGRGKDFECNEEEIRFLAGSMESLAFQMGNDCGALHLALDEQRKT